MWAFREAKLGKSTVLCCRGKSREAEAAWASMVCKGCALPGDVWGFGAADLKVTVMKLLGLGSGFSGGGRFRGLGFQCRQD